MEMFTCLVQTSVLESFQVFHCSLLEVHCTVLCTHSNQPQFVWGSVHNIFQLWLEMKWSLILICRCTIWTSSCLLLDQFVNKILWSQQDCTQQKEWMLKFCFTLSSPRYFDYMTSAKVQKQWQASVASCHTHHTVPIVHVPCNQILHIPSYS